MGKIGIIIRREYLTRIRNKTFIVMCFLAPLFFAALFIVPALLASQPGSIRKVVVVDGTYEGAGCAHFINYDVAFNDTLNIDFQLDKVGKPIAEVKKTYKDSSDYSVLYIPPNFMGACDTADLGAYNLKATLYSSNDPSQQDYMYLKSTLNNVYRELIFVKDSVPEAIISATKREVMLVNDVRGVITKSDVKAVAGLLFGMIIYIYILIFGVQVMRSVVEEKNTRIVEVIVSSVRPFQLMMGKIIAVALVGLTQFTAWVILSSLIISPIISKINEKKLDYSQLNNNTAVVVDTQPRMMNFDINEDTKEMVETVMTINWGLMIPVFIFYFIFGYLMYAAIFASVGSAADRDADTSQFSVPVTVPLIISVASSASVLNDPNGPIAQWLSMIPFTSPVVMLMRMPYGVSPGELILSMVILVFSFLLMTWLAGKIYRVGILMYGKKVSWRELWKWLFYKA
jgi:ABC-2 type transport system permease protein